MLPIHINPTKKKPIFLFPSFLSFLLLLTFSIFPTSPSPTFMPHPCVCAHTTVYS